MDAHESMLSLGLPHVEGTLEAVVSQGWAMKAPPGLDKAGPSNWYDRPSPQEDNMLMAVGFEQENESVELRNIANIVNERFSISAPPFEDATNDFLQVGTIIGPINETFAQGGLYSPTSPLFWSGHRSSGYDADSSASIEGSPGIRDGNI